MLDGGVVEPAKSGGRRELERLGVDLGRKGESDKGRAEAGECVGGCWNVGSGLWAGLW
jgi:hypothetical protein